MTFDDDVEDLIRRAMEQRRQSFKQVVNDAVRRGLRAETSGPVAPFVVEARPMGLRSGVDPAYLSDLDDELEIERYRRTVEEQQVAEP